MWNTFRIITIWIQISGMKTNGSLFTELNDENALELLLRSPAEFLSSVEAGARYVNDESAMANQYTMAANLLRDAALQSGTPWFYANPILFLYRHAIELHLKGILHPQSPTHSLTALRDALKDFVQRRYGVDITGWITDTITDFASIDPNSARFRYPNDTHGQPHFDAEQVVNLEELKTRLDGLFLFFMYLRMAQLDLSNSSNIGA